MSDEREPGTRRVQYLAVALGAVVLASTIGLVVALGPGPIDPGGDAAPAGAGGRTGAAAPPDPGAPGSLGARPVTSPRPSSSAGSQGNRWPGPATTGVPDGVQLTRSGSLTIDRDGTVVSGLDIDGCVDIHASGVTIRASRIACGRPTSAVRVHDGARGVLLEDVEIDGRGATSVTICCGDFTIRRADIHSTIDGPRLGSNSTVEDSWIHDLTRVEGSHNDTLQTTGAVDIVVRGNRLDVYRPSTGDPFNAALMLGSEIGPEVRNLLFEDNYCNGGNYTIGIRDDLNATNIVFRRNTFGRDYRYGVVALPDHPGVTWEDSNVYADTGEPVVTD